MDRDEQQLDRVFAAYRRACPTPEPSSAFMPEVWAKIDARRSARLALQRWTRGFVTAAVAACLAMVLYMALPQRSEPPAGTTSYVDALSATEPFETLAYSEMVNIEPPAAEEVR